MTALIQPDANGEFPSPADGAIWMLVTHGIPQTPLCGVDWTNVEEQRRGKAPFLPAWQKPENTLKTVEDIRAAAEKYPGCNFGSVFNRNTFAFEADTPPDGVPAVVVRFNQADGTFTSPLKIASSEGRGHRYYRWVAGIENVAQSLEATKYGDFSIRVDGEQCVSPGSIHPRTRKQYRVISNGVIGVPSTQEIAFWNSERVEKKASPAPASEERRLLKHGQMHGAYVAEAGRLWNRGYTADDVVEMTARWTVANSEDSVDEDKVRKEALNVTKIYKRGEAPESAAVALTQGAGVTAQPAQQTLTLAGEPRGFNPWQYALKPLMGQPFSGWFPLGRVTLVSGSSGAMKTTFLAQALTAGRDGENFLGHEPGNLPFLFLFADRGKYDCEETFRRMNLVGKVPFQCINGILRHTAAQVIADAANGEYKVLVVDGGDLLVAKNNEGESVGDFTLAVQRVAEHYGVAIVITTGAGKLSPQALKQGAERRSITKGSEVWGRTGGSVFTLNSEHDGTKDTRRLVVQHRNAASERFLLEAKQGRLVAVNEAQLEEQNQFGKVRDWVLARERFTGRELRRQFKLSGSATTSWLVALVKDGTIKRHKSRGTGKGANGRIWFEVPSVVRAMNEADSEYEKAAAANTVNIEK